MYKRYGLISFGFNSTTDTSNTLTFYQIPFKETNNPSEGRIAVWTTQPGTTGIVLQPSWTQTLSDSRTYDAWPWNHRQKLTAMCYSAYRGTVTPQLVKTAISNDDGSSYDIVEMIAPAVHVASFGLPIVRDARATMHMNEIYWPHRASSSICHQIQPWAWRKDPIATGA